MSTITTVIMGLKVKLHNARIWLRGFIGKEPSCCGYFKNPDGRLVECDEWWGYQDCWYPGCNHYQIEHSDGTPNELLYVRPELKKHQWSVVDSQTVLCPVCNTTQTAENRDEDCPAVLKEGDQVTDPVGCMNLNCDDCPGFWTKDRLLGFIQGLGHARRDAYWFMGGWHQKEDGGNEPTASRVRTRVEWHVRVDTTLPSKDPEVMQKFFEREQKLMEKHPDIHFDFYIHVEEPEKSSCTE